MQGLAGPGGVVEADFGNDFERDVLRLLAVRGCRPVPRFRIGGYRIDFVLGAPDGRRLAIERGGDTYRGPRRWESDVRRQAVLERVGNRVFVRIRRRRLRPGAGGGDAAGPAADQRAGDHSGRRVTLTQRMVLGTWRACGR
ncbi:hypothetical protein [Actinoplanes siamensis]|uniref:Restriction endonuclease type II-like domain-containing protein n=1 Tax=Actinoplanes siamensis TaxID=1223317 RepID=A0A919N9C9_9ACTN|nr:hypothetical protein [Actinoplanes siamensis]GIF06768.1 hypothetical protein Asi03nite_43060 [Actinoplanes siamensis]